MTPTADNIFLQPIDKKVTNLIVPSKYAYRAKEFHSGKVLMKGHKITQVEDGDEIAYSKDMGIEVELEDKKYVVIKPKHILAVV